MGGSDDDDVEDVTFRKADADAVDEEEEEEKDSAGAAAADYAK